MEDKIKEIKEFLKKWNKNNEVFVKDGKVTVGGSLDLRYTNITELPDNLTVGGWLDLRYTNITELPDITVDEISLEDLRKILVNDYGAETFWNLIDEK